MHEIHYFGLFYTQVWQGYSQFIMQLPFEFGVYPLIHFEQVLILLHIKHLDGQDKQD